LGIENVGTLMTRGVLLDIAAVKGVDILPETYEITVGDLQTALERQRLTLKRADAILLYTGFSKIWPRSTKGRPGIGVAAAEWLASQNPMVVGSDTGSVELIPARDPQLFVPAHQIMLTVNGIYLVEYLKLDELAAKRVYEFALILQPLKIKGSTGSTLAPVAIR
jgi:kynurenine formamidase